MARIRTLPEDFEVEEIPLNSLGKVDLGALERIAVQKQSNAFPMHIHASENS